jgi:hypothetical protein
LSEFILSLKQGYFTFIGMSIRQKTVLTSFLICGVQGLLPAQVRTDSLSNQAIYVESRPAVFIQAGAMANVISLPTRTTPPTPGFSGGVGVRKSIGENTYLLLEVNYQHKYFTDLNTTVYEPLLRSNLQLTTSAAFDELACPLICASRFGALDVGIGLQPSYLIHSILKQNVSGSPLITPDLRAKYNKYDTPYTAYFYLTNISPCIYLNLPFSDRCSLTYLFSFELVQNPISPYSFIQPYQFIQNKLSFTFKLYSNEKTVHP